MRDEFSNSIFYAIRDGLKHFVAPERLNFMSWYPKLRCKDLQYTAHKTFYIDTAESLTKFFTPSKISITTGKPILNDYTLIDKCFLPAIMNSDVYSRIGYQLEEFTDSAIEEKIDADSFQAFKEYLMQEGFEEIQSNVFISLEPVIDKGLDVFYDYINVVLSVEKLEVIVFEDYALALYNNHNIIQKKFNLPRLRQYVYMLKVFPIINFNDLSMEFEINLFTVDSLKPSKIVMKNASEWKKRRFR